MTGERDAAPIAWIASDTPVDAAVLGGKGAGLVQMAAAGLPVPGGYIVTTAGFDAVIDGTVRGALREDDADGASLAGLEASSRRLRTTVMDRSRGHPVLSDVVDAYRQLGDDAPVAVRSSASGEDSADHSFAGEHDSYLWVRGADDVRDAVRRCWASLYTARALDYRRSAGQLPSGSMAVVVQRMVDARTAGVFMTLNPSNGDRSKVVIEAVWGLGEPLVSGQVDPDRFVVDKVTRQIISRHIAHKAVRAARDPSGAGVALVDVAPDRRDEPCLTDAEIAEIVDHGRRIEAVGQTPQDGEFALGDDPSDPGVRVLQTRPETVWSRKPAAPVTGGRSALQQILHTIAGSTTAESDEQSDHRTPHRSAHDSTSDATKEQR